MNELEEKPAPGNVPALEREPVTDQETAASPVQPPLGDLLSQVGKGRKADLIVMAEGLTTLKKALLDARQQDSQPVDALFEKWREETDAGKKPRQAQDPEVRKFQVDLYRIARLRMNMDNEYYPITVSFPDGQKAIVTFRSGKHPEPSLNLTSSSDSNRLFNAFWSLVLPNYQPEPEPPLETLEKAQQETQPETALKTPQEAQIEKKPERFCDEEAVAFSGLDSCLYQGFHLAQQEATVRTISAIFGDSSPVFRAIDKIITGEDPALVEAARLICRTKNGQRLLELLTIETELRFHGEDKNGRSLFDRPYPFVYSPFQLPENATLNSRLKEFYWVQAGKKYKSSCEILGESDELTFPPHQVDLKGNIFSHQKKALATYQPLVAQILERSGLPNQAVANLMADEEAGVKLWAIATATTTMRRIIGKEGCSPVLSEATQIRGLKNLRLLWQQARLKIESDLLARKRNRYNSPYPYLYPGDFLRREVDRRLELRSELRASGKIIGQNIYLEPGGITIACGDHNCGKSIRAEALVQAISGLRSFDCPIAAESAQLPNFDHVRVVFPETRKLLHGSGLEAELRQVWGNLKQISEDNRDLLVFEDLFHTTDPLTACALMIVLTEEIQRRCPRAQVLINTHNANYFWQAQAALPEELKGKIRFEEIGPDHQAVPFSGQEVYRNIEDLVLGAIREGEKDLAGKERGPVIGRTDHETLEALLNPRMLLRILGNSIPDVRLEKVADKFSQLVLNPDSSEFKERQAQAEALIAIGSDWRGVILTNAEIELTEKVRNGEISALMKESLMAERAGAVASVQFHRLFAGEQRGTIREDRLVGCSNPGLKLLGEATKKISFPLAILAGSETASVFLGGNNNGKSEGLKALAWQIISDLKKKLGYDSVLFLGGETDEKKKEGAGGLENFMRRVGHLKARAKELSKTTEGKILVLIDEPGQDTAPQNRSLIDALVIKELEEAVGPGRLKVIFSSHCAEEELRKTLESRGISFSAWGVPSRYSKDKDRKPYYLYPYREIEDIDNSQLIEEICGPEISQRFLHYRQILRSRFRVLPAEAKTAMSDHSSANLKI